MINPNQLGRSPFPASASQWMLVGLRGGPPPSGLSDGDPVTTWLDSSGNGNNATQTGSARPTFKINVVNGKPVVRFTSAASSALNLTTSISGVSPWRVFSVMKPATTSNNVYSLMGDAGGHPIGAMHLYTAGNEQFYGSDRNEYRNLVIPGLGSAFHVFTVSATPGTLLLYVDGTVQAPSATSNVNTGNFASIGYYSGGSSDGDVAEIIVYSAAVSVSDRQNIEKYLGTKYGITVAGGSAVQPDTVTGLQGWWKADTL